MYRTILSGEVPINLSAVNSHGEDAIIVLATKKQNLAAIDKLVPILGTNQVDRYGNRLEKNKLRSHFRIVRSRLASTILTQ